MADNNIIIKITSEANLDAAQKQMKELTERAKEQEQAMRDLSDVEKQDAESIKQLGLSQEQLAKALKKNKDYYRELKDQKKAETAETKKSIKELENQVKSYKTLNGQSGRMVTQLRAMREQLMRMEEAGEFGTQAFMDLSIAAGQLEDQIGDTQQRIRVLASDTKEIDAVMGLGDGLAGSFYIATSAVELFGGEMEGLQEAFYKVQAAMSIVSGVQQVFNALNKDSAAMVVLNTALAKLFAKSKKDTAVATLQDQRVRNHIKDALAAVNMEFLAETPIDQSGVAKAYDANELNNFVNSVAEDLVRNIDLVYYFICEYRYRTIVPNEEKRHAMLPAINVPTKFDIANTTILMQELQGARQAEANPETLRVLETNYAKMQFNTSPDVAERLETVFDLDPLFGVKEENKMTMLQNGGITETAYIISCNIHAFVRRAIFEDKEFCKKDYDKKMQILEKYANEVRKEAEKKAEEKAQQQADFGGLDRQPEDKKDGEQEQKKKPEEQEEKKDE